MGTQQSGTVAGISGTGLPKRLLTIAEAAEFLNVPERWVQAAVQERRVRCTRIGKHVRFTPEHLTELVAEGEQPVTASAAVPSLTTQRSSRRSQL